MKLIHCADLHLDSPMESNLSSDKARERKGEIRATFRRLIERAEAEGVAAVLIAGDLFDSERVTKSTEKYVRELILSHPSVAFFYLAGNHDRGASLKAWDECPDNLFLFDDGWVSYRLGDVVITGSERPNPDTLSLRAEDCNVVLLHGQVGTGRDAISLGKYKGKNIDYMALGHVHEHAILPLDRRGALCYAGCLEGRGFDECGVKGYVSLEVSGGRILPRFVPAASRTLHTVKCDITGFSSQLDLESRVLGAVDGIPSRDMVKVILSGECPPDAHRDAVHLRTLLAERFYFSKLYDECRVQIRYEDYAGDVSLKGEFVRQVLGDKGLSQEEKERVIACGLRALAGEEIGV